MIDGNKLDPKKIWKILKEICKGEIFDVKIIDKIDFEDVVINEGINIEDKFNEY